MPKNDRRTAEDYLRLCPYFTSASLSRVILQMAEEEFDLKSTGLSPAYIHLIILVNDNEGISPSELARKLYLAPSTITRMIDKLVLKGILERKSEGKNSLTYPTKKSFEYARKHAEAFRRLYRRFTEALGKKDGYKLVKMLSDATAKLSE